MTSGHKPSSSPLGNQQQPRNTRPLPPFSVTEKVSVRLELLEAMFPEITDREDFRQIIVRSPSIQMCVLDCDRLVRPPHHLVGYSIPAKNAARSEASTVIGHLVPPSKADERVREHMEDEVVNEAHTRFSATHIPGEEIREMPDVKEYFRYSRRFPAKQEQISSPIVPGLDSGDSLAWMTATMAAHHYGNHHHHATQHQSVVQHRGQRHFAQQQHGATQGGTTTSAATATQLGTYSTHGTIPTVSGPVHGGTTSTVPRTTTVNGGTATATSTSGTPVSDAQLSISQQHVQRPILYLSGSPNTSTAPSFHFSMISYFDDLTKKTLQRSLDPGEFSPTTRSRKALVNNEGIFYIADYDKLVEFSDVFSRHKHICSVARELNMISSTGNYLNGQSNSHDLGAFARAVLVGQNAIPTVQEQPLQVPVLGRIKLTVPNACRITSIKLLDDSMKLNSTHDDHLEATIRKLGFGIEPCKFWYLDEQKKSHSGIMSIEVVKARVYLNFDYHVHATGKQYLLIHKEGSIVKVKKLSLQCLDEKKSTVNKINFGVSVMGWYIRGLIQEEINKTLVGTHPLN